MSRSGYSDDYDEDGTGGLWRGAVERAIKGKRGQAMLRELASALDVMPEKSLAAESLVTADGEFCTLGVLGAARGIAIEKLDPEDWNAVAKAFDIAPAMAREIVFENDETFGVTWEEVAGPPQDWWKAQPQRRVDPSGVDRWKHMRRWVAKQLGERSPV